MLREKSLFIVLCVVVSAVLWAPSAFCGTADKEFMIRIIKEKIEKDKEKKARTASIDYFYNEGLEVLRCFGTIFDENDHSYKTLTSAVFDFDNLLHLTLENWDLDQKPIEKIKELSKELKQLSKGCQKLKRAKKIRGEASLVKISDIIKTYLEEDQEHWGARVVKYRKEWNLEYSSVKYSWHLNQYYPVNVLGGHSGFFLVRENLLKDYLESLFRLLKMPHEEVGSFCRAVKEKKDDSNYYASPIGTSDVKFIWRFYSVSGTH